MMIDERTIARLRKEALARPGAWNIPIECRHVLALCDAIRDDDADLAYLEQIRNSPPCDGEPHTPDWSLGWSDACAHLIAKLQERRTP